MRSCQSEKKRCGYENSIAKGIRENKSGILATREEICWPELWPISGRLAAGRDDVLRIRFILLYDQLTKIQNFIVTLCYICKGQEVSKPKNESTPNQNFLCGCSYNAQLLCIRYVFARRIPTGFWQNDKNKWILLRF